MSQGSWNKWGGGGRQYSQVSRGVPTSQNPIFEGWIMEWLEEAEAKGTKLKYVFAKALKSIRLYPLVLKSGKECSILENFGAHMCKMIDQRMAAENMNPEPDSPPPKGIYDDLAAMVPKKKPKPAATATSASTSSRVTGKTAKPKTLPSTVTSSSASGQATEDPDVIYLSSSDEDESTSKASPPPAKKSRPMGKAYVPAYRSGGYALLLAMYTKSNVPGYRGFMTKTELLGDAQRYCDSSMSRPDATKSAHYTAWNSMRILLKKEYINKTGSPAKYMLTPEGTVLADKLYRAEYGGVLGSQASSASTGPMQERSSQYEDSDQETEIVGPVYEAVKLEPGQFEVVLYVDNCETNGKSKTHELVSELQKRGVAMHVTRLSVGDFVWVCREIPSSTLNPNPLRMGGQAELVLPYVVERKRKDDLAHSIRDGRYKEQKYRLKNTKLQVIYVVEDYGKGDWGLQEGSLDKALASTQIKDNFQIQETLNIKDTCGFLVYMTNKLKKQYQSKTVIGRTLETYDNGIEPEDPNEAFLLLFSDFNDFSNKKTNWNVQSLFLRTLIRIKGMSADKAYAITALFPTVDQLMKAYAICVTDKEKELLLANIKFGPNERSIGGKMSRKIALLYNSPTLLQ